MTAVCPILLLLEVLKNEEEVDFMFFFVACVTLRAWPYLICGYFERLTGCLGTHVYDRAIWKPLRDMLNVHQALEMN